MRLAKKGRSNFWYIGYRFIGDRLGFILPFFEDLHTSLIKSGLKITFEVYVSNIVFFTLVTFAASFTLTMTLGYIIGVTPFLLILLSTAIGLLGGALIFIALYTYPSIRASSRSREIEEELPYIISHMTVLTTAGVTPDKIFHYLAEVEDTPITDIARTTVRDIEYLGYDLVTALEQTKERSPSRGFKEFLEGFIATVRTGGDLKSYLLSYGKTLLGSKEIAAKEFGDTLSTMAEAYVTLLVVLPLLMIIMFSVMSIVSGSLAGIRIDVLMTLITYILIPLLGIMMLIMLDAVMPKGE